MRRFTLLIAVAPLSLPAFVFAQPVTGFYVGAGVGGNFMQRETATTTVTSRFVPVGGLLANAVTGTNNFRERLSFDPGAVGVGSVGFGFGDGLRVEFEGDYRYNGGSDRSNTGRYEQKAGGMANALYDFDIGSPVLFPYLGVGVGYMWADRGYTEGRTSSFAYQALAGIATPIPGVSGLSATLEYRFMGLVDAARNTAFPGGSSGVYSVPPKFSGDFNHSILIGLRYAFNAPRPAPVEAPAPAPPSVLPSRSYLVFFDWDRAELTDRARQIVAEAAQNSTRVQTTRIEVQGNADSSGTPAYNQRLSLRRAQTVAAELVRDGVASTAIDIQAFGDTRPLVPTAAGVREPQNRRVAIILK